MFKVLCFQILCSIGYKVADDFLGVVCFNEIEKNVYTIVRVEDLLYNICFMICEESQGVLCLGIMLIPVIM